MVWIGAGWAGSLSKTFLLFGLVALCAAIVLAPELAAQTADVKSIMDKAAAKGREVAAGVETVVRTAGVLMIIGIGLWGVFAGFRGQVLMKLVSVGLGLLLVIFADQLVDWVYATN